MRTEGGCRGKERTTSLRVLRGGRKSFEFREKVSDQVEPEKKRKELTLLLIIL